MKIGIVSRPDLPEAVDLTRKVINWLSGSEVLLAPEIARELGKDGAPVSDMGADALVTIGGDGTVLKVQHEAPGVPILGINMGGTGFLADVSPDAAEEAIRSLLEGKLELQERVKLAVKISGRSLPDALNEAVVRAASPGRALDFEVMVDDEIAERAKGDGVIVSTPTGSTAYNLAAGGPVLDPRLEAFSVAPLCTHRPRAIPLVVPMSSTIRVRLLRPDRRGQVAIDGYFTEEVSPEDELLFYRSEKPAKFFKWGNKFYKKVREKL